MSKKYDYSIVMGRFEPFHLDHDELCEEAESLGSPIILTGSAQQARTPKNPFTAAERLEMIGAVRKNALILPMRDYYYSDESWVGQVQEIIGSATSSKAKPTVCIVGHVKDASSYYLRMFPEWKLVNRPIGERKLNATDIRAEWLSPFGSLDVVRDDIPASVYDYMRAWKKNNPNEFAQLREEHEYYRTYSQKWGQGPHITTDAIVTCGGRVLLIRRGECPGKGLWGFPGGFLGLNELIQKGMLRELKEETSIDCPVPVLKGSIVKERCFDHPFRSLRGRVITHCTHIALQDIGFPKVKAKDDADMAEWKTVAWCKAHPELFFEDHYHIFESMILGGSR